MDTTLVLGGGVVFELFIGCFYLWGNISQYVVSYFYHFQGEAVTLQESIVITPIQAIVQMCFNPVGAYFYKRISVRLILAIGTLISVGFVFISSFTHKFIWFIITYGVGFTIGIGFTYFPPMLASWEWLPKHKGFASGMILCGFGFGAFIFGFVAKALVNPDDEEPTLVADGDKIYSYEVAERVPFMLQVICGMWLVLGAVGVIFVKRNQKLVDAENAIKNGNTGVSLFEEESAMREQINKTNISGVEQTDDGNQMSMKQGLEPMKIMDAMKCIKFYHIFVMIFCSGFYGMYMAAVFKNLGSVYCNISDSTLTLAGSLGSSCNGLSRVFWATLSDKFGFKRVYFVLLLIQVCVSASIYSVCQWNAGMYVTWVCISYWCLGGQFALFPPMAVRVFGPEYGGQIYSVVFSGFSFSSLTGFIVSNFLIDIIGNDVFFYIAAGLTCISLALLVFFKEVRIWKGGVEAPAKK